MHFGEPTPINLARRMRSGLDLSQLGIGDRIVRRVQTAHWLQCCALDALRENAPRLTMGQHRPDTETDVDLSPEKSACSRFGRAVEAIAACKMANMILRSYRSGGSRLVVNLTCVKAAGAGLC